MCTFKDFLHWFNNKEVVPTLEAKQKIFYFYHKKIDMLKLGCTLPHLASVCLLKSTTANFNPFIDSDEVLLEILLEDVNDEPSIVFARKTVVDKTFIRDSTNCCKSIVGIDASQFYPFSLCQAMSTGLYTRRELDSEN